HLLAAPGLVAVVRHAAVGRGEEGLDRPSAPEQREPVRRGYGGAGGGELAREPVVGLRAVVVEEVERLPGSQARERVRARRDRLRLERRRPPGAEALDRDDAGDVVVERQRVDRLDATA